MTEQTFQPGDSVILQKGKFKVLSSDPKTTLCLFEDDNSLTHFIKLPTAVLRIVGAKRNHDLEDDE